MWERAALREKDTNRIRPQMTQMDTDRGRSDQDLTDRTGRAKGESGHHTDDKRSRTLASPQDLDLRPSATSA
jgi:hypothetical protein